MRIPLEFYETLRDRINLSDVVRQKVSLTRKAGEHIGLCPFHLEKSPSFTVNDSKRFYHCFGCNAHGDVIKFVSKMSGLSYKESAIKLAEDYGIELPKLSKEQALLYDEADKITSILELAVEFFNSELNTDTINYLAKRGIDQKIIEKFEIGFAPAGGKLQKFFDSRAIPLMDLVKAGLAGKRDDGRIYEIFHDRIMFPIRNVYNKVIAFGGRVIGDGMPKYLNSPETMLFKKNETLYGENKAITAAYKKHYAILVEGYMDVIALHKTGFEQALASLGTSVTEGHIQKLWRAAEEIIVCLDGDAAGIKASSRVINLVLPLLNSEKKISFITLPAGSDPDDIINRNGGGFFQKLIDARINLSTMIWQIEFKGKNFTTPESKANLENNLANYCKQIKDRSLSINYHRFFKDQIWQNLLKRKDRQTTKIDSPPPQVNQIHSEVEILEHAICSLLVQFPEIIQHEEAQNFLQTVNFKTLELSNFRDWFFEIIENNTPLQRENLEELVKKTRFYDTFLLLLSTDNQFLGRFLVLNKNTTNYILLWELLHKKYYLALLQQECAYIIQSGLDNELEKAKLYQQEMAKISKELQKLTESFIT